MATPSTQCLTDVKAFAPNATSITKSIAAAGPIQDLAGNAKLVALKLTECVILLTQMRAAVDSGDSAALAIIDNVLASLD